MHSSKFAQGVPQPGAAAKQATLNPLKRPEHHPHPHAHRHLKPAPEPHAQEADPESPAHATPPSPPSLRLQCRRGHLLRRLTAKQHMSTCLDSGVLGMHVDKASGALLLLRKSGVGPQHPVGDAVLVTHLQTTEERGGAAAAAAPAAAAPAAAAAAAAAAEAEATAPRVPAASETAAAAAAAAETDEAAVVSAMATCCLTPEVSSCPLTTPATSECQHPLLAERTVAGVRFAAAAVASGVASEGQESSTETTAGVEAAAAAAKHAACSPTTLVGRTWREVGYCPPKVICHGLRSNMLDLDSETGSRSSDRKHTPLMWAAAQGRLILPIMHSEQLLEVRRTRDGSLLSEQGLQHSSRVICLEAAGDVLVTLSQTELKIWHWQAAPHRAIGIQELWGSGSSSGSEGRSARPPGSATPAGPTHFDSAYVCTGEVPAMCLDSIRIRGGGRGGGHGGHGTPDRCDKADTHRPWS
ncbi:MAG: hypothetical protein WDW36_003850 [Sanguina aurantia]